MSVSKIESKAVFSASHLAVKPSAAVLCRPCCQALQHGLLPLLNAVSQSAASTGVQLCRIQLGQECTFLQPLLKNAGDVPSWPGLVLESLAQLCQLCR